MAETLEARAIRNKSGHIQLDKDAKTVFALKIVQALMLKDTIPELKDYKPEDIAEKFIEGEVRYDIPVSRFPHRKTIVGDNTESIDDGEATVYFDIRYKLNLPISGEHFVECLVDVEPQGTLSLPYHIENRANYYIARMISTQLDDLSEDEHYDKLKKVFSFWVCFKPPAKARNSIIEVSPCQRNLFGNYKLNDDVLGLWKIYFIMLGKGKTDSKLLNFLNTLFNSTATADERIENLRKYIPIDDKFEKEARKMMGLGAIYIEEGIDLGIAKGRQETENLFTALSDGMSVEEAMSKYGKTREEILAFARTFRINLEQ